jgi:hypothetical protein
VALPGCDNQGRPPVMKRGKIGHTDHLRCMNSEVDMCFVAEDFLPQDYLDGPPEHVKGAVHPEGIKDLCLMPRWMTGRHSCWKQ